MDHLCGNACITKHMEKACKDKKWLQEHSGQIPQILGGVRNESFNGQMESNWKTNPTLQQKKKEVGTGN